ncbi:DUF2852 domain-containing protein [Roseomonas sp. HJA6]|uniref:DUF2852 domain-containing protein n=1 Tax=Roseomonas alba TaxID=2846776 RepID=A0ABS7AD47_9PROT|nr:DUF2852 domain-containing protein [Neoroseomonas alba]MBW6400229.1 DUF2852 domain-containing protein [Neoroseomonas alba]
MSGTAYPDAADYPGRRERRWRDSRYTSGPCGGWAPWNMPKPLMIVAMVFGFILFWPIGLAILFFMIGSGRIGRRWGQRFGMEPGGNGPAGAEAWPAWCGGSRRSSSGNAAFDEYREETIRRLEEEQKDFADYLERLRFAKDRAEFEQFMAERRPRPPAPPAEPQQN